MIAHARPRRPGTGAQGGRKPAARRPSAATAAATTEQHHAPRPLTATQRRYLRGLCHDLKPLVQLGNRGLTAAVTAELDRTLDDHELVKVRLSGADRTERQEQIDALLAGTDAELVQQIGHVVSVYRRNRDKPQLALPA